MVDLYPQSEGPVLPSRVRSRVKESGKRSPITSAEVERVWTHRMINGIQLERIGIRGFVERVRRRAICLMLAVTVLFPRELIAGTAIPGEDHGGIFYTVTHLHPAAYFILFLIVLLSAANLVFHRGMTTLLWPVPVLLSFIRRASDAYGGPLVLKGLKRSKLGTPAARGNESATAENRRKPPPRNEAVVSVQKIDERGDGSAATTMPTPLEGVDHTLPKLTESPLRQSTTRPGATGDRDQKSLAPEFRFSSAVDVPSPEEIERREKTQVLVTGSVLGSDEKPIGSAIVYLTDEEGNRVGQSCRSMTDTGEFKVLINEPGTYRINAYKRGFVMENSEPLPLPIESGKIEGFCIRMLPEGCTITGSVVAAGGEERIPGRQVTCVCRGTDYSRWATTDPEGQFRITGVPINAECHLEVQGEDGSILIRTDTFQTVQKRELHHVIEIAAEEEEPPEDSEPASSTIAESDYEAEEQTASAEPPADDAEGQSHPHELPPGGGSSAPAAS